jgi:hypothetical protein
MAAIGIIMVLLSGTVVLAQSQDSSTLDQKTGPAIQGDSSLPLTTKRGRCNPASTRCQLPRHRVQPKDSDLNAQTESGHRFNSKSSLNSETRTGPLIADPSVK